jgi:hypothetical protein
MLKHCSGDQWKQMITSVIDWINGAIAARRPSLCGRDIVLRTSQRQPQRQPEIPSPCSFWVTASGSCARWRVPNATVVQTSMPSLARTQKRAAMISALADAQRLLGCTELRARAVASVAGWHPKPALVRRQAPIILVWLTKSLFMYKTQTTIELLQEAVTRNHARRPQCRFAN